MQAVLVEITFTGEAICRFCLCIYPGKLSGYWCSDCKSEWSQNADKYGGFATFTKRRRIDNPKRIYRRVDDGPGTS